MKINYFNINNTLDINKKQIQASIASKTKKDKDYRYKLFYMSINKLYTCLFTISKITIYL